MMANEAVIEVLNLSKVFTRTVKDESKGKLKLGKIKTKKEDFFAVDDINFTANKGEIYGILGPNGAGKTTLLRMLGGILTQSNGSITLGGCNYEVDRSLAKKKIGYLSGNTKLYGRMTPRELFKTFGELYEMGKDEINEAIEMVIKTMHLEGFIDNRIENLSTGQTQRVSIARCLVHSPDIYIFDEPTLGLDVLSSRDIIEFMKSERLKGKTVLYSTHYMEEAETLCDRLIMIHTGKIIAEGTPKELKEITGKDNLRDVFIHYANKGDTE